MIRKPIYTLLALAAFGISGLPAQAEETKDSAPTEQAAKAKTKKEKLKERRAARKQKRAEKKLAKKEAQTTEVAPATAPQQTAAADEPAGRPRSNTPIVIAPPKPPTPAPVFSES